MLALMIKHDRRLKLKFVLFIQRKILVFILKIGHHLIIVTVAEP